MIRLKVNRFLNKTFINQLSWILFLDSEGKLTFVDETESFEKRRKIVQIQKLYPSIGDIVVAMKNKFCENIASQTFEYNGIYVSVDKITQMVAVNSPENQSVFIIQRACLSHVFRCDLKQN